MKIWECQICGYAFGPPKGHNGSDKKAKTQFKKLPDEWTCPGCGSAKELFEEVEENKEEE